MNLCTVENMPKMRLEAKPGDSPGDDQAGSLLPNRYEWIHLEAAVHAAENPSAPLLLQPRAARAS